jgi:GTP-binding protein
LGIQFLKHLERTRLLLHIVDACADLSGGDAAESWRSVEGELGEYSQSLADKPRWLVLNKLDLLPEKERDARIKQLVAELLWQGPVYGVSALTREGTQRLAQDVMTHLEQSRGKEPAARSGHGA